MMTILSILLYNWNSKSSRPINLVNFVIDTKRAVKIYRFTGNFSWNIFTLIDFLRSRKFYSRTFKKLNLWWQLISAGNLFPI